MKRHIGSHLHRSIMAIWVHCVIWMLCCTSVMAKNYYMDSPTTCGQSYPVAEDSIFVRPRGTGSLSNPPASCILSLESSYSGSAYKFEIVVEAAQFRDCNMQLRVFDGAGVGGSWIRMFGCGTSSSTGQFYSKGQSITIQLTRTRDQYYFGNDFRLRITVYRDPNSGDEYIGTNKLNAGAVIGIIMAIIILIGMAILLGWCYKTGRIPGLNQEYPETYIEPNIDKVSSVQMDNGHTNGNFVSWHGNADKSSMSESRSNFDLNDSQIWDSLTGLSASPRRNNNTRNVRPDPVTRSPLYANRQKEPSHNRETNMTTFSRTEPNQLSNSPSTRLKSRFRPSEQDGKDGYNKISDVAERGELGLRGRNRRENSEASKSGMFENPDKEGYLYDYEQVKKLAGDDTTGKKEGEKPKTKDFASELQDAIKRNSMKRVNSEGHSDTQGSQNDDAPVFTSTSQIDESDLNSASALALNKQTDGETTGPDAHSSPKPKKKKRKNSKSPKSKRKNKNAESAENTESKQSPKAKPRRKTLDEEKDLPPELFAPIFSDDDAANSEYQPELYQPGYQGYPMGYPAGQNPMYPMMGQYGAPAPGVAPGMYHPGMHPPGAPYQQAGQAQWFVETGPNGQNKMAFAMTTHSQSSQDDLGEPGRPNYQSTPYNNQYRGHYPEATPGAPGANNSLVPAGTILDDPQIPPPGTSLVRYDDDPVTGVKTSQVIWADSKPDPTDPPPGENPQVTRKTITRITTRSTKDDLPDAPGPSLQEMSFRTAQQMQASGNEPAFMSPTRQPYLPPHSAIQYATETPERSNASYYESRHHIPPAIVHEPAKISDAFKDRITVNTEPDLGSV